MAPYSVMTIATYECDDGYVLRGGTTMRTCNDNSDGTGAMFNGSEPTCEREYSYS